jgi:hypothetical protein
VMVSQKMAKHHLRARDAAARRDNIYSLNFSGVWKDTGQAVLGHPRQGGNKLAAWPLTLFCGFQVSFFRMMIALACSVYPRLFSVFIMSGLGKRHRHELAILTSNRYVLLYISRALFYTRAQLEFS